MTRERSSGRIGGVALAALTMITLLACTRSTSIHARLAGDSDEAGATRALLRAGLRAHLGEVLFARIADAPYWNEPGGIHELSHRIVRGLQTSRRGCLPGWLEEGLCRYLTMHVRRWKDKEWDEHEELMARLAWDHPGLRVELFALHGDDELLAQASLGLVLGLESEVGSGELIELLKRVFVESPETDRETMRLLEAEVGKPIFEAGHLSGAVRNRIYSSLVERARGACGPRRAGGDGIRLAALGHFPDRAERVVPILESLASCPLEPVAAEGAAGLRYLRGAAPLAAPRPEMCRQSPK